MRVFLEATETIYACTSVTCSKNDRDGFNQVFFKLSEGLTLIVELPAGDYKRLVIPRMLKEGYYRISETYHHRFVCSDM